MDLLQYKVWCEDEAKFVLTDFIEEDKGAPTTCPTDPAGHTITSSLTSIESTILDSDVHIKEEDKPTGGHFQTKSFCEDVGHTADTWEEFDISFKHSISLLSAMFIAKAVHETDEFEFIVGPDTTVGAITVAVAINDTEITVSQAVIDNISVGFKMKLYDGTNTDDLGMVLSIDKENLKVTVETPAANAFTVSGPITYVKQSIYLTPGICILEAGRYVVGESKIGGSYIPANTIIRMRYKNVEGTTSNKNFNYLLEYLY